MIRLVGLSISGIPVDHKPQRIAGHPKPDRRAHMRLDRERETQITECNGRWPAQCHYAKPSVNDGDEVGRVTTQFPDRGTRGF